MQSRQPTVYLLASHRNGTLYVGVTSDLTKRLHEHRNGLLEGFTKDYGVNRLVRFERHETMGEAILRERRIRKWRRQWKVDLIEMTNPIRRDLALDFGFEPARSTRLLDALPGRDGFPRARE